MRLNKSVIPTKATDWRMPIRERVEGHSVAALATRQRPKTFSAACVFLVMIFASAMQAQTSFTCACGKNAPGPPPNRSLKPYAGAPEDLRPFSKFTTPYYEYYQDLIEYNGAAREIPDPDLKSLAEVRIGFLAPLYDHPDQVLGNRMLNGATMAIDEANAAGGYGGKPFRLITHNDYDNWQTN